MDRRLSLLTRSAKELKQEVDAELEDIHGPPTRHYYRFDVDSLPAFYPKTSKALIGKYPSYFIELMRFARTMEDLLGGDIADFAQISAAYNVPFQVLPMRPWSENVNGVPSLSVTYWGHQDNFHLTTGAEAARAAFAVLKMKLALNS